MIQKLSKTNQLIRKYIECQESLRKCLNKKIKEIGDMITKKEDSQEIIYYECRRLGHMKTRCPKVKRKSRLNRKSLMET